MIFIKRTSLENPQDTELKKLVLGIWNLKNYQVFIDKNVKVLKLFTASKHQRSARTLGLKQSKRHQALLL